MRIFNRLFGNNKNDKDDSPKRDQNYFLTNSSDYQLGEIELGITGKVRVDGIVAITKLQDIAKKRNKPFQFSVIYTTLLEEGALTVPIVCSIGEDKYSLYFIYKEEELLKYKDLITQIEKTAYPKLLYFSSIPIYKRYQPKKIIEPFQLADLRHTENTKTAGQFAMWWSTDEDTIFHTSVTYDHLVKMYDIFRRYESYLVGYILRQIGVLKEIKLQRMPLPEESIRYIIDAPEEKKVILNISREKGIRFLFPIHTTTKKYRERFLHGAMIDFLATRMTLEQQDVPRDQQTTPNSYDWFHTMAEVIKERELFGKQISKIGLTTLNSLMN